jgi:hypothetical protein
VTMVVFVVIAELVVWGAYKGSTKVGKTV